MTLNSQPILAVKTVSWKICSVFTFFLQNCCHSISCSTITRYFYNEIYTAMTLNSEAEHTLMNQFRFFSVVISFGRVPPRQQPQARIGYRALSRTHKMNRYAGNAKCVCTELHTMIVNGDCLLLSIFSTAVSASVFGPDGVMCTNVSPTTRNLK